MSLQLPALALSCAALLTACGGGGGGASGSRAQSVDFPYPGARYLAMAPAPLVATTSSGLPVTFASNTPANCTVTDGKLVPVAVGNARSRPARPVTAPTRRPARNSCSRS